MHLLLRLLVALAAVGVCAAARGTLPDDLDRPWILADATRNLALTAARQDELRSATREPIVREMLEGLADAIVTLNASFRFPTAKHFEVYRELAHSGTRLRTLINTIRDMHAMSPLDEYLCSGDRLTTEECRPDLDWVLRYDFPCHPMLCFCSRMRVTLYMSETPLAACGGRTLSRGGRR
jgi:hypothetical protein